MLDAKEMLEPYLEFEWKLEHGGFWGVYRRWLDMRAIVAEARAGRSDDPATLALPPGATISVSPGAQKVYDPGDPDDYLDDLE